MITQVSTPSFDELTPSYRKALADSPSLTPQEEKDLASRMHQGDRKARDQLFRCNLRLVLWEARKYLNRGLPFSDLIQEGHIGLLKALAYYDPDRGYRLATYATYWIIASIHRALLKTSRTIRLPAHVVPIFRRYLIDAESTGFYPEPERMGYVVLSLERLPRNLEGVLPADTPSAPDNLLKSDLVNNLLSRLTHRERTVLIRRYGLEGEEPQGLRQVGKSLGISYERVRQIQNEAIGKLRQRVNV